jgi:D-alanyl-D-alanine carboxypeptidase/D-alanyl-D-alanine-endopeptidase (penicillin-binding protein 4)
MRPGAVAATVLLAACTSTAPSPSPPAEPVPASPSASASPTGTVAPVDPLRLQLFVDARWIRAGTCTPASVSIEHGRLPVRLEWRFGGAGPWSPVPAGPERRLHGGLVALPACPGWNDRPVEVRAAGEGAEPSAAAHVHVRPEPWMRDLEALIGDRPVSVSVMADGAFAYGHLAEVRRTPASNEKLLLSMALLDRFGPDRRIPTEGSIRGRLRDDGVVEGDLVLEGNGDPELDATDLHRLAARLVEAGLRRVAGSVVGDTGTFVRDRGAPGWHPIALRYIGLPTALSFEGNVAAGGYVFDPEQRAAAVLTDDLRSLGVTIGDPARATGAVPNRLRPIASVRSAPLGEILRRQNVSSSNQDAETLSKLLALDVLGRGSIANGARVIEEWANGLEAGVTLNDASGLSYRNRVSTASMAALLDDALRQPWGRALFSSLPAPGEGTLGSRLAGVEVRAKTGTLIQDVSALSGYVRLRDGTWASFSIMSLLPKDEAVALEDAVVRAIAANG